MPFLELPAFVGRALVGDEMSWGVRTVPLGAAGFIAPGSEGTFSDAVPDVAATDPDVVVVAGGYADADVYPAVQTGPAARAVLEDLRAALRCPTRGSC